MRTTAERKLATQRILAERLQARLLKSQTLRPNLGEDHVMAKLTEEAVRHIRASDEDPKALAERYGVSVGYIGRVRRGRAWKHLI